MAQSAEGGEIGLMGVEDKKARTVTARAEVWETGGLASGG